MKGIYLNEMEKLKYTTIKNVVSGRTTKKRASAILNLSLRQIDRLVKKYNNLGEKRFCSWQQK